MILTGALCAAASIGAVEADLEVDVALDGVVHQHGARLLRRQHVDHRRQFLVFDHDLGRDVFRLGARVGDAHGDQLADVPDLVGHQRRLLRRLEARQR